MKFRTIIKDFSSGLRITHKNSILTLGSCFSDEIGKKLEFSRFNTLSNPFGTIYNPRVFEKIFQLTLNQETTLFDESIFEKNGKWFSYWFHSSLKSQSRSGLVDLIKNFGVNCFDMLKQESILILTLGTARAYFLTDTKIEVGNCHKFPANKFQDQLLSVDEITTSIQKGISQLREKFNRLEVILTVSPIRHLKDGLIGNQRSKARLVLAAEKLSSDNSNVHYFPAYEILLDDLRDYRFYSEDLLHPNQLGIDYIWENFQAAFFDDLTLEKLKMIEKITKGLAHIPFDQESNQYKQFLLDLIEKASNPNIADLMVQDIEDLKKRIEKI